MRQTWAIFKWGMWQRRWFLMWWCLAVSALIAVNLAFWPSFKDQANNQAFQNLPDSAKALTTDTGDYLSPVGFLSSQIYYLMLPMLLIIMNTTLGSSLLAREEKEGTIELLLSRPISRSRLLIGKAATGITLTTIVAGVGAAVTIGMANLVDLPVASKNIAVATAACLVLSLSFGMIAFLITCLGKARIASIGLTTLVALGGYIIVSLSSLASWLKGVSRIFPFYYYKPGEILFGRYHLENFLVFVGIIVVASVLSWVAFRRRDIG